MLTFLQRYRRRALILLVAGLSLPFCYEAWFQYQWMVLDIESDDQQGSTEIAARLRETRKGLDMALNSLNLYGSGNRGWSNWMLKTTYTKKAYVDQRLREIASDEHNNLGQRLQANFLLYEINKDLKHLEAAYNLARPPGTTEGATAREFMFYRWYRFGGCSDFDEALENDKELPPWKVFEFCVGRFD